MVNTERSCLQIIHITRTRACIMFNFRENRLLARERITLLNYEVFFAVGCTSVIPMEIAFLEIYGVFLLRRGTTVIQFGDTRKLQEVGRTLLSTRGDDRFTKIISEVWSTSRNENWCRWNWISYKVTEYISTTPLYLFDEHVNLSLYARVYTRFPRECETWFIPRLWKAIN